ncbi:MAG: YjjG family noncanonical pyrimidine nucleotidase [Eubacteriales bacterium]|nr:YjjG family noncanonical pyrimidine nucleotidase [Eubacteriales bacterium]
MNRIKVLLWDIDGTVLNFKAAEKAAVRKGFRNMSLGECTDEMISVYSDINDKYWQLLEKGELAKPEILVYRFRDFFIQYGIDPNLADSFNAQYQYDLGDTICFNDNAYELLKSLGKEYRMFAVTNGTAHAQHKKLTLSVLIDIFDDYFISDEIGYEKPSKEYFNAVFNSIRIKFDFSPDEAMIIGDSLTSDITGGINAGIRTCWYNPGFLKNTHDLPVDFEIRNLNEIWQILSACGGKDD